MLGHVALIQKHAIIARTHEAMLSALRDFNDWLLMRVLIRDINSCTPEDVMLYFTMHWTVNNSGSSLGKVVPTSVKSLSRLSR